MVVLKIFPKTITMNLFQIQVLPKIEILVIVISLESIIAVIRSSKWFITQSSNYPLEAFFWSFSLEQAEMPTWLVKHKLSLDI